MLTPTLVVALLAFAVPIECSVGHVLLPGHHRHLLDTDASPAAAASSLLSDLPLEVVSATPTVLLSPTFETIPIVEEIFLQVVFSRAVIPLGSDGGNTVPFTVAPAEAGRFRWLNSYIARFEPAGLSWPTDLQLTFTWNRDLVSFDGVELQGTELLQVRHLTAREPARIRAVSWGSTPVFHTRMYTTPIKKYIAVIN